MVPLAPNTIEPVVYPESDGKPIADNTRQFDLIVLLKTNLDDRLPDFVAGDLFWYPVQGHPEIVVAPDVMVAFGRPKGERRSYKQWEEAGVAPQVAVEVLSPANTVREMMLKAAFYARHGVEEYYVLDPDNPWGFARVRQPDGRMLDVEDLHDFVSPRLGIRFDYSSGELEVFDRDGRRFETTTELRARAEAEAQRAEAEAQRAEAEAQRAEAEAQRAEAASRRADAEAERARLLEERLRAAGLPID